MWLSVYILCVFAAFCKCCLIDELPGRIIGCYHEDSVIDLDIDESVEKNTICLVKDKNGIQHLICKDGDWIETAFQGHDIDRLLNRRHKRGWWSNWWGGRPKPRDGTPPSLECPRAEETHVIAEPFQLYGRASWPEPIVAHDDKDGTIRAYQISGRSSGRHFPENHIPVKYEAKDRSGNRATCDVQFTVEVVRCPVPASLNNGYFICHPSTEFVLGGYCIYGCYDGFALIGENRLTCQMNKQWSPSMPTCEAWKCPALPNIEGGGLPSCTNGQYFRSICTYNCSKPGYDMPPNVAKTLVCSVNKSWRQTGQPRCIDVEPPVFKQCPATVVAGTDRGSSTSKVSWVEPFAEDNSGETVSVSLVRGHRTDERLPAGQYDIVYGARDKAGNQGRNCKFAVIVRDMKCSKIYPTPYMRVSCPDGIRTGAICDITCDPGKTLLGVNVVSCDQSIKGLYGAWNWRNDTQSLCKNTMKCTPFIPPKNGALACDNWLGGEFCQAQCRYGSEMPRIDLKQLYVCDKVGEWKPSPPSPSPPQFKPCQVLRNPHQLSALVNAAVLYNGDCTSKETREQIANNFIHQLQNSLYQPETCPNSHECNKDNVQVFCGEVGRRKRSALISRDQSMNVTVQIRALLQTADNIQHAAHQYQLVLSHIEQVVYTRTASLFGNITITNIIVTAGGIDTQCPVGTLLSASRLSCVECPPGTFYHGNSYGKKADCQLCPKGSYQNLAGQVSCERCPFSKTTDASGASDRSQCEDACPPGYESINGLHPCSPCSVGFFQSSYGQTYCRRCRGTMTTETLGSTSSSKCNEFDINFAVKSASSLEMFLRKDEILYDFTLHFWIRSAADGSRFQLKLLNGNGNVQWLLQNVVRTGADESTNSSVNLYAMDSKWHNYVINVNSCSILVYVDGFHASSRNNTDEFKPLNVSKMHLWSDGKSKLEVTQLFIMKGIHDLRQRQCLKSLHGDVVNWQDFDDADLNGAYIQMSSQCDDWDECQSSPCKHGNCTDMLADFSCLCKQGYTGKTCEINIDDCIANVCMNGATCVDGHSEYICSCAENFTGQYCEIQMVKGQWSEWGNWSECTATCGEGYMVRKRLCTNPTPDNGGKYCIGDDNDTRVCNQSMCPICPYFVAPVNGSATCTNSTDGINCTVSCKEGFDFDMEPMPLYECGIHTTHVWNYETYANTQRRLPKCTEISDPVNVRVKYYARYKKLSCLHDGIAREISAIIATKMSTVLNQIQCVASKTCVASFDVSSCTDEVRNKRSTETVGLNLTFTSPAQQVALEAVMSQLEAALNEVKVAAELGAFTVPIQDDQYELDLNQTKIAGDADCPGGHTRVSYYCVPCGIGSYLKEDVCEPCPVGQYQDQCGQLTCKSCPDGITTLGEWSENKQDCSVSQPNDVATGLRVTVIAIGCGIAAFVMVSLVFAYRRFRAGKAKHVVPSDVISRQNTMEVEPAGSLGPSKPIFHGNDNTGSMHLPSRESSPEFIRMTTFIDHDGKLHHPKPWK